LVTDRRGNIIVGAAIILLLSGFAVMRQMMRHATRY
jgi:Flp pilus assembly protein TadB